MFFFFFETLDTEAEVETDSSVRVYMTTGHRGARQRDLESDRMGTLNL